MLAAVGRRQNTLRHVPGPDRLEARPPRSRQRGPPAARQPLQQGDPGISRAVDDRGREHRGLERRPSDRPLGQRLGPEEPRALELVAPIAREEEEALDARALGRSQQPHRGQPVQLLDRPPGWSRIVAARWITVCTPRIACRIENGSARSPSEIWTLTRRGPAASARAPAAGPHGPSRAEAESSSPPTTPVAPVNRIMRPL